jgi:hypothetical protein
MPAGAAYAATALAAIAATAAPRLLERHSRAIVLERLARGGGGTNWFLVRTPADVQALANQLRPGSCVSFYFDDRFTIGAINDDSRTSILDIAERDTSAVVGALSDISIEVSVDFPSSSQEIDEFLAEHEATSFMFGRFPGRDNDATRAVTLILPDADGITRAHPY